MIAINALMDKIAELVSEKLGMVAMDGKRCWFFPVYEPETPHELIEEMNNSL